MALRVSLWSAVVIVTMFCYYISVKGVNFYVPKSEFIVSGSDCGHIFLWDKETEEIVQYLTADDNGAVSILVHLTLRAM